MKPDLENAVICVIGLGYVGLPLAKAFSKSFQVIGFDVDGDRIKRLNDDSDNSNFTFTGSPQEIRQADFIIMCVPTPVTESKDPDLSYIERAAEIVSQNMKKGCIVILESTVYPGVTEEVVVPILEEYGLKCGEDFRVAYSPERINPGDKEHTLENITKVVAGIDSATTELVAELYAKVVKDVFVAKSIKTAEAAKVIENVQRDLNIALMNELSLIFDRMELDIQDIMEAAATKWNFHSYSPGLVGGHCIPVDPYYLVHKAKQMGYHPQVISAGRTINDSMPKYVANKIIQALIDAGKTVTGSKVLLMGLTYKENVADTRETPVMVIIDELKEHQIEIFGHDPYLLPTDIEQEFDINAITSLNCLEGMKFDVIVVAVAHDAYKELELSDIAKMQNANPILVDVRRLFNRQEAKRAGFLYRTL